MTYYAINKEMVMQGYGILFAIIGLNILLYVPIMKTTELQEALE
jgi:hypothetical protein